MDPTFNYFFRADPVPHTQMYALYDVLDGHFMIQSHDYNVLYRLMYHVRPKTYLEVVAMPYNAEVTNANIEQWQIVNLKPKWFGDLYINKEWNPAEHLAKFSITDLDLRLEKNSIEFTAFKRDLQKQIFFLYRCFDYLEKNSSKFVDKLIKNGINLSTDYKNMVDRILDNVAISSADDRSSYYDFLRQTGLFYE